MSIYERVIEYCKEQDIPVYKFEQICGIGNGTISKWRKRNVVPSIGSLVKISIGTDIPLMYWIGGKR